MTYKTKKVFALIVISCASLVGLLSIYRATLKPSNLKVVTGKVLDKKIEYFTSYGSGRHYCLAFHVTNIQDKIAVNLGTKKQAENDSTFYLIDIGKTYKFYLDPTVPTTRTGNWGIRRIDYNDVQVYQASNKLNLFGGIIISLMSLAGIIILLKYKKDQNGS
jgi:hypothetical protein